MEENKVEEKKVKPEKGYDVKKEVISLKTRTTYLEKKLEKAFKKIKELEKPAIGNSIKMENNDFINFKIKEELTIHPKISSLGDKDPDFVRKLHDQYFGQFCIRYKVFKDEPKKDGKYAAKRPTCLTYKLQD